MPSKPSPTPDKPAPPRSTSWVLWGLVAMVVLLLLPFPLRLAGGAAGLFVFVAAIIAMVRTRKAATGFTAVLLVGASLLGAFTAAEAMWSGALYGAISDREECMRDAITNAATEQCDEAYSEAVSDRLRELGLDPPAEK